MRLSAKAELQHMHTSHGLVSKLLSRLKKAKGLSLDFTLVLHIHFCHIHNSVNLD